MYVYCIYTYIVSKYHINLRSLQNQTEKLTKGLFLYPRSPKGEVYKNQLSRQTGSRNLTGPKTLPTIWYTNMMLVTKYQISAINSYWEKCDEKYLGRTEGRYTILWVAFLDPSDSYFLFADLVGFYTHWTYMLIFHHIFLSNYWWQRSDIWSQASYRYPCSLMIPPLFGKQELGIWWVKKRFPRYGVPISSLWPNIRFLPSIVAEKNVTKNVHICSILLMAEIWYLVTSLI
jgi:hypothetical protein